MKCPQCDNDEFLVLPVVRLKSTGNELEIKEKIRDSFSCRNCGFRAETSDDFKPETVTVWIVGDGHAKRRQGLAKIAKEHQFDSIKITSLLQYKMFAKIDAGYIFTIGRWKKFKDGDIIPLSERNYTTEEIDLTT